MKKKLWVYGGVFLVTLAIVAVMKSTPDESQSSTASGAQSKTANGAQSSTVSGSSSGMNAKWTVGMEYAYLDDGSCTSTSTKKCVDYAEYRKICDLATGVTKSSINMATMLQDKATKSILGSGRITNIIVTWVPQADGCGAVVEANGIYDGSSMTKSIAGQATVFLFTEKGNFLVSYIDTLK